MNIYVLRHGQTVLNVQGKFQGRIDTELTEVGINQVKKSEAELKKISFDKVFVSPLKRAIDTAKIVTNKELTIDNRLIERSFGALEGNDGIPDYEDRIEEFGIEPLEDIKKNLYSNDLFNIAGDYEISNRTYTDQDKKDIRRIKLNGQIVSGLVTELDHPDWVDLPLEDMYDLLQQEREQASKEAKDDLEQNKQEQPNDGEGQGSPSSGSGDRSSDSNQQGQQVGNSEDNSGMSKQGGDTEGPGQAGEKGDQSTSDEGDGQGSNGSSDGENGNPSNNSSDDSSQSNGSVDQGNGSDTGSKNDGSSDSRSSNGSSNKIIHGTFKNGKFYGLDGKEIIPGGNA